jgi:ADP-ribosylglycohydrolase
LNIKERFANALYAQAVCDAVGDRFEFEVSVTQQEVIDHANIIDKLEITDDTQMALFLAEAYNEFTQRVKLVSNVTELFTHSLENGLYDWYLTQTDAHAYKEIDSGLASFASMYKIKAPGLTCLSACESIKNDEPVVNDSKGCGSVMRIIPYATLINSWGLEGATFAAKISGDATHKHPENAKAIEKLMLIYDNALFYNDTMVNVDHLSCIEKCGLGWTAMECVDMAIYANAKAKTFDEMMSIAIAHGGDSDSVGAVAGSIWGLCGKEVPIKYVNKLAERDAIDYVLSLGAFKQ